MEPDLDSDQRQPFVEPPRRPILGAALLLIYITLLFVAGYAVLRITHVADLIVQSQPMPSETVQLQFDLQSTRNTLWKGPLVQRLDIMRAIAHGVLPREPFEQDLRRLAEDRNRSIANAAQRALGP